MKLKLLEKIDGYELEVEFCLVVVGDECVNMKGELYSANTHHMGLKLTPERKVVDWGKVDKDVLVHPNGHGFLKTHAHTVNPGTVWDGFQAHMLSAQCPVDPDAFMTQVWYRDNTVGLLVASSISWEKVTRYRVTGLAPNYEYK